MTAEPAPFPGDLIPEPYFIVGDDGRVVDSNRLARTALCRAGPLIPGSSWNGLLGPENARQFEALVRALGPGQIAHTHCTFGTGDQAISFRLNVLRLVCGAAVTLRPVETPSLKTPLFFGQVDAPLPAAYLPTVTHAMKTLMAAARTASFLLAKKYQPPALSKEHRWLAGIDESVNQSTALLDQIDLLHTTVLEVPGWAPEPTDVSVWLGHLTERTIQAHPGTKVSLACHSAARGRWWLCTALVGTAVGSLLSNTLKFAPAGSQASVRANEREDGLEIVVSDEGAGLPEREVAQLFTPFFRGANARQTPGCGLGLAIARAAVLRVGGTISYRVAPGPRVEFFLRLPAKAER